MEHFFLASDGGGTKVECILFDEDLRMRGYGRSGGTNGNFIPEELCIKHHQAALGPVLEAKGYPKIDRYYVTTPYKPLMYLEDARRLVFIDEGYIMGEHEAALLAGGFRTHGMVALSGTGSCVHHTDSTGKHVAIGGKGSLVDDEGSGYYIGRLAISHAIKGWDGRSTFTSLSQALLDRVGVKDFGEFVTKLYKIENNDFRSFIASLTVDVVKVAATGDEVARRILRKAGRRMALQVITLRRTHMLQYSEIMLSGSVWRDNPVMLEAFTLELHKHGDYVDVVFPIFKPVMGGVIRTYMDLYGEITPMALDYLKTEFSPFLYMADSAIKEPENALS